ncbi:MAG: hypothetical protein KJO83_06600 [Bacteroidia bacterium]|nr:hypothetical protein [Bacteroidia bacterium]
MSLKAPQIAMKMLNDLREEIVINTSLIDDMISRFLANRLGVNDVKTINALGTEGALTFKEKVTLFCDVIPISKIDKAKFKVFIKIYYEFLLDNSPDASNNQLIQLQNYYPFLFNTYLVSESITSIKEKLIFAVQRLINDVVNITTGYIVKPQIYYNKEVGITLPE